MTTRSQLRYTANDLMLCILQDYGLKDGECVSVGSGGDGGSADGTFRYTNCLL